jgi:DNA-binding MarR family transcriptional regulator
VEDNGAVGNSPADLDHEAFQVHANFRYVVRRFLRYSEDQARLASITPQQHLLLLAVRGHPLYPKVTIKDIAQRLQLRHHSTSLLVDRAVRRGLVTRAGDPADRRRVIVSLTDDGAQVLHRVTYANRAELRALDAEFVRVHQSLMRVFEQGEESEHDDSPSAAAR